MSEGRKAYNWNLTKFDNKNFREFFDKQDNISASLYSLVCHFTEKYGVVDVMDFKVQQSIQRELLLNDKDFMDEMRKSLLGEASEEAATIAVEEPEVPIEAPKVDEPVKEVKVEVQQESPVKNDAYKQINTAALFGK